MRRPEPTSAVTSSRVWRLAGLLTLTLILGSILVFRSSQRPDPAPTAVTDPSVSPQRGAVLDPELLRQFNALEHAEHEADRTIWSLERRAEQHASAIERLWESLNASTNGLALLRDLPLESLSGQILGPPDALPHGIQRRRLSPAATSEPAPIRAWTDWRVQLDNLQAEGWRLVRSEWRHTRFNPGQGGARDSSWFEVRMSLSRTEPIERAQLQALVRIDWPPGEAEAGTDALGSVRVERAEILQRAGAPLFEPVLDRAIAPFPKTAWIDPVVVHDLDHDGVPEIYLVARNLVLRRDTGGKWNEAPISPRHPGLLFTALLADFTGDGVPDLLMAVREGLVLLRGSGSGRFEGPLEPAWIAPQKLQYAQAFTCGDFDQDGDLDVFLGQYRTPYQGGQMPTPYFDANDGPPAYLLRNDGVGRFEDVTAGSGLEPHRNRRSYAASFADLDDDGDLDLVVTSDFAGMELYENDGRGHFNDRTARWIGDGRGFGMSHAFSDFNGDGRLDLLSVGMPQPTADRLSALQLEQPGHADWAAERTRMTVGNRLFLGAGEGFDPAPAGPSIARAGWAWSAAAFDFDHDRFPDLHVVNGHETRQSVRDYETEFWTHDIYLPSSTPAAVADAFFAAKFAATRGRGWSYGGHHENRFFLNLGGRGFADIGHLAGVGLVEDSRNVVAEDFDGDGRVDLLVTTFEIHPEVRQTLRLFSNRAPRPGHWIGFRLPESPGMPSPVGAEVRLVDRSGVQIRNVVTGDGYRSQSGPWVRFGLGEVDRVESAEVRWPGGWRVRLGAGLVVDRMHEVPVPVRGR